MILQGSAARLPVHKYDAGLEYILLQKRGGCRRIGWPFFILSAFVVLYAHQVEFNKHPFKFIKLIHVLCNWYTLKRHLIKIIIKHHSIQIHHQPPLFCRRFSSGFFLPWLIWPSHVVVISLFLSEFLPEMLNSLQIIGEMYRTWKLVIWAYTCSDLISDHRTIGLINLGLSLFGSCRPVRKLTNVPTTTTMMIPIKVYHKYESFKSVDA